MKSVYFFVVLGSAFFATVSAHAKIERNVEKKFTVTTAGTLRLDTSGGAISVMPGPEGVVTITAREKIRANSDADADELLKDLELKFEQNGADVSATAKYDRPYLSFHFGSWPPVQVDFIAVVPASFASDVRTSGGSITIGNLAGKVNARTSGGAINLGKLGGAVDARTSGGGITLDEALGETKLDTSGGAITVGRVTAPADLSTSGGGIRIEAVEQTVRARTSGGSIRAGIVGPLNGDCTLSTSGGSVRVTVDKTAAFRLDASTSGGGVDANGISITLDPGKHDRHKLAGVVNAGGPLLKLRTSGGSISVAAR